MSKLAYVLIAVSTILIAWIFYWGRGMPNWALVLSVSFVLVLALLIWAAAPRPSAESLLAQELSKLDHVVRLQGTVMGLERLDERETHTLRELKLSLQVEPDGAGKPITLLVMIEDVLLPAFSTGSKLHLLQDPERPERVAIDRQRSPTHVK